jgi:hypothetical protein
LEAWLLTIGIIALAIIAVIVTVFVCATKSDSRHVSLEAGDWLKLNIERGAQRKRLPRRSNGDGS